MKSFFPYFGGKFHLLNTLLELVPYDDIYCEVFGGSAKLLLNRRPSPCEVYNDANGDLVNVFKIVADVKMFEAFRLRLALLPYSRELFNEFKNDRQRDNPLERAVRTYYILLGSFAGKGTSKPSWGYNTESITGMAKIIAQYLSNIKCLPEIHARLQRCQMEHNDWRKILNAYDSNETVFYLDPPYMHETRSNTKYTYEMSDKDHEELIELCKGLKGQIVLSGYRTALYDGLLSHRYKLIEITKPCASVGRTKSSGLQGRLLPKKDFRKEAIYYRLKHNRQLELF